MGESTHAQMAMSHPFRGKPEPQFPIADGVAWSPADPEVDKFMEQLNQFYADNLEFDSSENTLTLYFRYPYEVDLDDIKTERDLLAWVLHLAEKTWMTTRHLRKFAERVAEIKGLKIHGLKGKPKKK
jgi:hypothetical protein